MPNGLSPSDWRVTPIKRRREGNVTYGPYRCRYIAHDDAPPEMLWIVGPDDERMEKAAQEAVRRRHPGVEG